MSGFDLVQAPDWVLDACRKAQGRRLAAPLTRDPAVELDLPESIAQALRFLEHAPPAIQGEGGDHATYAVAARMHDLGLSVPCAFEAMGDHWNDRCEPPWAMDELLVKIENAYRYARGRLGAGSVVAEFQPVEILEPPIKPKRKGLYRLTFNAAADSALALSTDPLVEGLLDTGAMSIVYGDSNSGKTFVMLDIAFHVAAGLPWQGRAVKRGLVVYIAAEGGQGIKKRIAALERHYKRRGVPLDLIPCPVNLRDSKVDMQELLALVREAEAEHGVPAVLVVVDTLSRALAGGDENASTDMGAFVRNIDHLRAALGAHICVIHHTGKDTSRGARGWSGLRAATDTEIEIIDSTIKVSKQRDMEPCRPMKFTLEQVDIGKDERDRVVSSCVIRVLTGTDFVQLEMTGAEAEMYEALVDCAKEKSEAAGDENANWKTQIVSGDEWDAAFADVAKKAGTSARTRRRLRNALVEGGNCKKVGQDRWVVA